jgi:uncharacterized protein
VLFAVKTFDRENSGALRDKLRREHLDYLKLFESSTSFDGPFLTDDGSRELGSFKILDMPDRAAVERHEADEPFIVGGLQYGMQIYRYDAHVPYTFRDCPRTKGNIQFLILAFDKQDQGDLRVELEPAHRGYCDAIHNSCITFGTLADDENKIIGTLMILDAKNIEAARDVWENDPFVSGALFETVEFYRWRFGRIFDQFSG